MRNLFNKKDAAIDLTSLLDVIFIVLLVVMCSQKYATQSAQNEIEQAQKIIEESSQIVNEYEQHMDKYEAIEEYVLIIDVTASFDASSLTERHLSVFSGASSDNNGVFEKDITPKNEQDVYASLEKFLETRVDEYIFDAPDGVTRPVILSVNRGDGNILYRDEQAIEAVFINLQNKDKYKDRNLIYVR